MVMPLEIDWAEGGEREIGYKKSYKMRQIVKGRKYISVAIPYEVVERQATIAGLTVEEFLEQYIAVAEYNNFEGIRYTFEKVNGGKAVQNG